MSADNWGYCPACNIQALAKKKALEEAAAAAYGRLPVEEFDRLRSEAAKEAPREQTLREDYEVGIDSAGEFYVIYEGRCSTCGWGHEFRHREQVPIPNPSPQGQGESR